MGAIGKPVGIRRGPAAVSGDEPRRATVPWDVDEMAWEGAGSRMIHEPEDLPACL